LSPPNRKNQPSLGPPGQAPTRPWADEASGPPLFIFIPNSWWRTNLGMCRQSHRQKAPAPRPGHNANPPARAALDPGTWFTCPPPRDGWKRVTRPPAQAPSPPRPGPRNVDPKKAYPNPPLVLLQRASRSIQPLNSGGPAQSAPPTPLIKFCHNFCIVCIYPARGPNTKSLGPGPPWPFRFRAPLATCPPFSKP